MKSESKPVKEKVDQVGCKDKYKFMGFIVYYIPRDMPYNPFIGIPGEIVII